MILLLFWPCSARVWWLGHQAHLSCGTALFASETASQPSCFTAGQALRKSVVMLRTRTLSRFCIHFNESSIVISSSESPIKITCDQFSDTTSIVLVDGGFPYNRNGAAGPWLVIPQQRHPNDWKEKKKAHLPVTHHQNVWDSYIDTVCSCPTFRCLLGWMLVNSMCDNIYTHYTHYTHIHSYLNNLDPQVLKWWILPGHFPSFSSSPSSPVVRIPNSGALWHNFTELSDWSWEWC